VRLLTAVLALLVTLGRPAGPAGAVEQAFEYRVSWNGIPAARATVQLRESGAGTPPTTEMRADIRTNRVVDLFWSLRAQSWGRVDSTSLRPQHFEYDRRINGTREFTTVEVEPDGQLTGRYARPGRVRLIEVRNPEVLDPIAAILQVLRDPPLDGHTRKYEVFTGEARYRIELRRDGSDVIKVPAGRFVAARLEPVIWRLEKKERDKRVRHLLLWMTEAAPHILLRIRSEVFIGAVYCDLTDLSPSLAPAVAR
jgi:hypothetical protein